MPNRGEVWKVVLTGSEGHEQKGSRPALIFSVNELNHSGFRLVIAIPITSNTERLASRVYVDAPEGGLTEQSAIMCEQILRLDIDKRLAQRLGTVTPKTMAKVGLKLIVLLGID